MHPQKILEWYPRVSGVSILLNAFLGSINSFKGNIFWFGKHNWRTCFKLNIGLTIFLVINFKYRGEFASFDFYNQIIYFIDDGTKL